MEPTMTALKAKYVRALIVDDSRLSRKKMRDLLTAAGFKHLDDAANAAEAAAKMESLRYDLVMLDWLMPGKSGVSLMEQWRNDGRYDDVAVIVVSTEGDRRMIQGALKAGALAYIVKPVSEEELQAQIDKALAWLGARRKMKEE
jgi:two-component system chemotaxis response regulator CheY